MEAGGSPEESPLPQLCQSSLPPRPPQPLHSQSPQCCPSPWSSWHCGRALWLLAVLLLLFESHSPWNNTFAFSCLKMEAERCFRWGNWTRDGRNTSRNWKEFQGIWERRNVRYHLVPSLLFIQSFYFTGKKAWGPETLNDSVKVSQLVGGPAGPRPLDFQPLHRVAFLYLSQSQLFSACFLKILRVTGCANPFRIPFHCLSSQLECLL